MGKIKEFQIANGLTSDGVIGKKSLLKMKEVFGIDTNEELAHFVGQCAHESGNFSVDTENLNYSADGLLRIFSKYFKANATALKYARKPEQIANYVYANRNGNADEKSGDGWKYRGRGAIQLTGKSNYISFSKFIGNPLIMDQPDLVSTKYFFESAIFFFKQHNLFRLCKTVSNESIKNVTLKVNGGTNGLEDRIEKTKLYYKILNS